MKILLHERTVIITFSVAFIITQKSLFIRQPQLHERGARLSSWKYIFFITIVADSASSASAADSASASAASDEQQQSGGGIGIIIESEGIYTYTS